MSGRSSFRLMVLKLYANDMPCRVATSRRERTALRQSVPAKHRFCGVSKLAPARIDNAARLG